MSCALECRLCPTIPNNKSNASVTMAPTSTTTHTHKCLTALFPGSSGSGGARRNLLDFMVQEKITEADTPKIRMRATPSRLISDPPPSSPPFLRHMPFLPQPSQFILAWDRHQICWLAYPVAWLTSSTSTTKQSETETRWLYCVECPQYSTPRRSASNIHRSGMLRKNR